MKRIETDLPGVYVIEPKVFQDRRGYFMETYNARAFRELGIDVEFVQDNSSGSVHGVLRGLHYQLGRPQAKLVRVVRGEVYDVAVDIRRGSPTFGRWVAVTLTGENRKMLFVPEGFAHGFCVVSEWADFAYKCSDFHAPKEERGIAWNDPDLGIPWPLEGIEPILSEKDTRYPALARQAPQDLPLYAEAQP